MRNLDIRMMVSQYGLKYKEIAACMGITAIHLSRLLSSELKPKKRIEILDTIYKLQEGRKNDVDA